MKSPVRVWLSLGSNIAGREEKILKAAHELRSLLDDMRVSDPYVTSALNGRDPDYMNAVVSGLTSVDSDVLSAACKDIERRLGRSPLSKQRGEVEIDIDVVVWNDDILRPADFSRSYFMRGYRQLSGR